MVIDRTNRQQMQLKRSLFQYISLLVLLLCLAGSALAARGEATLAGRYEAAKNELAKLEKDSERSGFRHEWEKVERLFLELSKDAKGWANEPAVLYRIALVRDGLSSRSLNKADCKAAAESYEAVAKRFPKSALADDSLLAAARLRMGRLGDEQGGKRNLERILSDYPRGDMATDARALLSGKSPDAAKGEADEPSRPTRAPESAKRFAAQKQAVLRQVSWKSEGNQATVTIEFDRETAWEHQFIQGDSRTGRPSRLYIDVDNSCADEKVRPGARISGKVLSRIRVDLSVKGRTRVIVDFDTVQRYDVDADKGKPYRIIVKASSSSKGLPGGTDANAPVPVRTPAKPPKDIVEQLGLTVSTIMIDAGHGGKDPGAMDNSITESAIALDVAKIVAELLREEGFKVLFTRSKNNFIPLDDRTQMANNSKADLFVSLHVNANADPSINGIETYYLDLASTSSAAKVASRENSVSEKNLSDLQFILTDLMLSAKTQESRSLASVVQSSLVKRVSRGGFGSPDNGVRSAPFYVLMGARMPAVLIELGYCTNSAEAKRLGTARYRRILAEGIVEGLTGYKRKLERYSSR